MVDYLDTLEIDLDANEVTFTKGGKDYTYSRDLLDDKVIFGISDKRPDKVNIYYQGEEYTLDELREANIDFE